ncbi:MAG: ABC transporter substrate-binding protein [Ruminiclostridium sp.]
MSFRIITTSALLAVSLILTSCSADNGENYIFKTVISENPATLDPQTSVKDSAEQVIPSVFRGLYRFSGTEVLPDMAESCEVSDDGLVWEFTLEDNVYWQDGGEFTAKCTAYDYEFAFRRLLSPAAKAKRAEEYYCIKNAEKVNRGELAAAELGVEALSELSLRITLERPCQNFRALLAQPPAMPCNEEFFLKTKGQYGLFADCIASNGDFWVSGWHYDKWSDEGNYISLRRNAKNAEQRQIYPYGINFFIGSDGFSAMKSGEIECYSAKNPSEAVELSNKFEYIENETAVWGIVFGGAVGKSAELRAALGGSIQPMTGGEIYSPADFLIPTDSAECEAYRQTAGGVTVTRSDIELTSAESLSGLRMIMPENSELRKAADGILQTWQKKYGFFCSISELSESKFTAAFESGEYDIAFIRINGCTVSDYFAPFVTGGAKVENQKFVHIMNSALSSLDIASAAPFYLEAEQFLLESFYFVPICTEKEQVYFGNGVSGIEYCPKTGTFDFGKALKK